jgi:ornithine cyclodeaminase/alanine dehydrogenase-like protein (mu-crystallin family)
MRRELDDATFDQARRLVVTSKDQIHHDRQIDILGPVERGLMAYEDIQELGDVLLANGSSPPRGPDDVTVFANNTGMGLQFAAVCARVLERAEQAGLGREVPTEWFLEETTP